MVLDMSCLPSISLGTSISSVLRYCEASTVPAMDEHQEHGSVVAPPSPIGFDSPYDKLSRVSVSHRRVDSFEWVMRSAPNTPPSLGASGHDSFSPPPARQIGSAPLPVPNEDWSGAPISHEKKGRPRIFRFWSSPSLDNKQGYTRLPTGENWSQQTTEAPNEAIQDPSSYFPRALSSQERKTFASASPPVKESTQLRPSEELNALGIILPPTPPLSPPTSTSLKASSSFPSPIVASRASAPRLPKRVAFSPIIDEVILESDSDFKSPEQHISPWGSYLPSSFLVARPPLPRSTSLPVAKGKTTVRPILRPSTSSDNHPSCDPRQEQPTERSTEMMHLSPQLSGKTTPHDIAKPSPMPTQRLSAAALRAHEHGRVEGSEELDRAFVLLLESTHKPLRRRCDSMLSTTSSSLDERCKSPLLSRPSVAAQ